MLHNNTNKQTFELLEEIHRAIKKSGLYKKPVPDTRFHKHRLYVHYGLYIPVFRKIMKNFKPQLQGLTLRARKKLAMELIRKNIGELGHAGIMVLTLSVHEVTAEDLSYIDKFMDYFCSWSLVDHICSEVLQPMLDKYEKPIIKFCRKLAESENRWKRRASVVVFTRKAGASGKYTDIMLDLCDKLKWDKEDIVQKGIGWALKDNLKAKPRQIINYVKKLRREGVSSTITLYAIRDLKGKNRKEILTVKQK